MVRSILLYLWRAGFKNGRGGNRSRGISPRATKLPCGIQKVIKEGVGQIGGANGHAGASWNGREKVETLETVEVKVANALR